MLRASMIRPHDPGVARIRVSKGMRRARTLERIRTVVVRLCRVAYAEGMRLAVAALSSSTATAAEALQSFPLSVSPPPFSSFSSLFPPPSENIRFRGFK